MSNIINNMFSILTVCSHHHQKNVDFIKDKGHIWHPKRARSIDKLSVDLYDKLFFYLGYKFNKSK